MQQLCMFNQKRWRWEQKLNLRSFFWHGLGILGGKAHKSRFHNCIVIIHLKNNSYRIVTRDEQQYVTLTTWEWCIFWSTRTGQLNTGLPSPRKFQAQSWLKTHQKEYTLAIFFKQGNVCTSNLTEGAAIWWWWRAVTKAKSWNMIGTYLWKSHLMPECSDSAHCHAVTMVLPMPNSNNNKECTFK